MNIDKVTRCIRILITGVRWILNNMVGGQKDETNDEEDHIYILNLLRNAMVRRNYVSLSEL